MRQTLQQQQQHQQQIKNRRTLNVDMASKLKDEESMWPMEESRGKNDAQT